MTTQSAVGADADVLTRLGEICARTGLDGLTHRLTQVSASAGEDLEEIERELRGYPVEPSSVGRSAAHLLDLAGKRLRPLCVALAARAGSGFDAAARHVAVAVELVHSATLLHDDVVDLGEQRRGEVAARLIYGNAASIFAGDWLLVEALRRVQQSRIPDALNRLLAVLNEMILAEAIQLDLRGRLSCDRQTYFRVIEGKTASLFRWALFAGARAGGLEGDACQALEDFGGQLGVAFQVIDDTLDFEGESISLGKSLFTDLRDGKMTLPLILAAEREPSLKAHLAEVVEAAPEVEIETSRATEVLQVLKRTDSLRDARTFARARVEEALAQLDRVPPSAARTFLAAVAESSLSRVK